MSKAEVWLRGPLPGILPALQPVAHALLQAQEELNEVVQDFPVFLLWQKPAGAASVGFHLQHMTGVLDRLFTYAKGQTLSEKQLQQLAAEGKPDEQLTVPVLLGRFNSQLQSSLQEIKEAKESNLYEIRGVGRAQIPSTVIGLMVHAAEHTMRHLGQLMVTVKVLKTSLQ